MVVIRIKTGKIRGKLSTDRCGKKFYSFQNIPYGAPPIGELRFKTSIPAQEWNGIKDCTNEGNESLSRHLITKKIVGAEDCLNLNVYTPHLSDISKNKALKPVMFFIHGGVFMTGSNKTELLGPEFLMIEEVVLVIINYRLGILGFLSLDDPTLGIPGNAGFKDMVLALKWVHNNIVFFGGDPNNVTVFGQSAGAAAAHLLMLSPQTKGLLHKVIAQSASSLNTWVYGRKSHAKTIAAELGLMSTDERIILKHLQELPADKILEAQLKADKKDFVENQLRLFGFVVERESEDAFLTEKPIDVINSGNYNQVPLIMGYCHNEGMAFETIVPARSKKVFFEDLLLSVPLLMNIHRESRQSHTIANKLQQFYFGGERPVREKHLKQYYSLTTDTSFFRDVYFSVAHHVKTSTKPIYFYRMSLQTELNCFKKLFNITEDGIFHGDDLCYIFKTMFTPDIVPNSVEDIAQRRYVRLWANFARCGNPTPKENDDLINISWKNVQEHNFFYLDIGKNLVMKSNPEPEKVAFWTSIFRMNPAVSKL